MVDRAELVSRAKRLRRVFSDCDGVLTDSRVYYSDQGEALKCFSVRDGMGIERLRDAGIETVIITRENSAIVSRRAEKLRLPQTFLGVWDKRRKLQELVETREVVLGELAYIGDDINDLEIIRYIHPVGLTGAPADAIDEIKEQVHFLATRPGGHGAFREFAEWILSLRRS